MNQTKIFKLEISGHNALLKAKRRLSLEWKLVAQQIAFYLIFLISNFLKFCSLKQTRLCFIFLESYLSYSCFEYSTGASCEAYHVCKLVFFLPLKTQQQGNALEFCLTGIWWKLQYEQARKARKTRTSPGTLGLKKFGLGKLWVKKISENTLSKNTLSKNTLSGIHFWKIHFWKIHFR